MSKAAAFHRVLVPLLLVARLVSIPLLLCATRTARAEEPVITLSLAEALKRAAERAPDVVLAGRSVQEARAARIGAGVVFPVNPRITADARPPITGGTLGDLGYSANLELFFEAGGAPAARVTEAERGADVAVADLALERLRSRIAAYVAYLQARVADNRIADTKALEAIGERILRASQQRGQLGASGDIESTLANSDLAQLRAASVSSMRQREEHLATLRELLDLPPTQPVVLTTPLDAPPPPIDADRLVTRAIAQRPELAQLRARLALLDARHDRLGRERFPRLGAYVGVDAAPVSPIFGVLGISIELPVFQRNQGPRAVVDAARVTEQERAELQQRRVLREIVAIRAAYEARRAELLVIEESAVPAAERTFALVEQGWLAGRFDVFRVATAARDVARVRASRLDALEAAWVAKIALDRAAGEVSL